MKKILFSLFVLVLLIISCKVKYSFSGANIDPNIKTVSIAYFDNNSGNGIPNMGDLFTNELRDKILRETNLSLVTENADVEFSGAITQYYFTVQSPTGNTTSDLRRITMAVNVDFKNKLLEDDSWNTNFQQFSEHSVDIDLTIVEEESVNTINSLLVNDIFNKAFAKW